MAGKRKKLTDDQLKALDDAAAVVSKAMKDAHAKLSPVGLKEPTNGSFQCLRCDCEHFVRGPNMICKRSTCGHHFVAHDVQ
jgi:hypothetical protein